MQPGFLSEIRIQELESIVLTEKNARKLERAKAILLHNKGYSFTDIGIFQFRSAETISRHIQEYLDEEKLSIDSGGKDSKLTELQSRDLVEHLSSNSYAKAINICHYVKQTYGIHYSVSGMTDWLHLNGFSYRKPPSQPAKADLEEQKKFIKQYQELKEESPADEPILFLDGVHPTMQTKVAYGWVCKGKKAQPIKTAGARYRMNILGALELDSMNLVSAEFKTINSETMSIFLGEIRDAYPDAPKIHIILDGASYNKSYATQQCAKRYGIQLHILPAYSPNLNSIERLWKVMNEKVRNNIFFSSRKEFRERITAFLKSEWFKINHTMQSRINDNFQSLKPAF